MPRISALPQAVSVALADQFPIVQGAVTKRVTFQVAQDNGLFTPGPNSITTIKLVDKAVTADKLQSDPTVNLNRAVSSNHIQDGAVSETKLNTDAVTTIKIQDQAVTFGKLGPGSLALSKFNDVDRTYIENAATARPGGSVITSGFVKNIEVYVSGSGYTSVPTVTISSPGGTGRTATATAVVSGQSVVSIIITDEGSGYTTTPTVTIAPPGTGTTAKAYAYTVVNGLSSTDPRASSIGTQHGTFVITTDRKMKSWGYNGYGQLGHAQNLGVTSTPVEVLPYTYSNTPSMPVKIYSCGSTSFYIDEFGSVWSAGYNGYGQTGLTGQSFVFQQISPTYFSNKKVIKLATTAGAYTDAQSILALTADGSVYGWGYNGYGQLGLGTTSNAVSTPTLIPGTGSTYIIKDIVSIGAVSASTTICAFLQDNGRVLCSGYNGHGSLSDGTVNNRSTLGYWNTSSGVPITNVTQMHGNGDYPHLALLTGTGEVWTSGYNANGQLGNGGRTSTNTGYGTRIIASGATTIYGNGGHYGTHIVTMSDGTIRVWGYNGYGQCGNGGTGDQLTPADTFAGSYGGRSVLKAVLSQWNYTTSAILLSDGSIYCCGYDGYGKQGRQDGASVASRPYWDKFRLPRSDVVDFRWQSYAQHCNLEVLTSDGKVYSAGYNGWGSLCRGDTIDRYNISNYLL
jgi:alpha-tubulin suppressor-like RCC1 family protein